MDKFVHPKSRNINSQNRENISIKTSKEWHETPYGCHAPEIIEKESDQNNLNKMYRLSVR